MFSKLSSQPSPYFIHIPKKTRKFSSNLQIYTFIFAQLHIITKSLFAIICLTLNNIVYRNDYKSMNQLKLDLTFYTLIYPHFFLCPCYALIDIIVEYRSMLSTSYPQKTIPFIYQIKAKHPNLIIIHIRTHIFCVIFGMCMGKS